MSTVIFKLDSQKSLVSNKTKEPAFRLEEKQGSLFTLGAIEPELNPDYFPLLSALPVVSSAKDKNEESYGIRLGVEISLAQISPEISKRQDKIYIKKNA